MGPNGEQIMLNSVLTRRQQKLLLKAGFIC